MVCEEESYGHEERSVDEINPEVSFLKGKIDQLVPEEMELITSKNNNGALNHLRSGKSQW